MYFLLSRHSNGHWIRFFQENRAGFQLLLAQMPAQSLDGQKSQENKMDFENQKVISYDSNGLKIPYAGD